MNLKYLAPLLLVITLFFAPNVVSVNKSDYYQDEFRPIIIAVTNALGNEINVLHEAAVAYNKGSITLEKLKKQLIATRVAYKKSEVFLEYYYPKHVKAYINGPPLNHLDPFPIKEEYNQKSYYIVTPEVYAKSMPLDQLDTSHYQGKRRVVPPVGLQVLDELLFSDEAETSKEQIVKLTLLLKESLPALQTAIDKRNYYYDFEVMEAARLELVRMFSMGITGFDTPGSLNVMQEATASLQGIRQLIEPLSIKFESGKKQEVEKLFNMAIKYLSKNTDFDTFDRLTFLIQYINPLYKSLYEGQKGLGIGSSAERWDTTPAWNYKNTNIFADDFLNPYYYSMLKESDDSEGLRALGKKLFYDETLSQAGTMSCATCHKPELGFTDGLKTSMANVKDKNVLRNAPTLINAVFADKYFYDLRALDLEDQAGHVIENHLEFNTSFEQLVGKLNANPSYKKEFTTVFGKGKPFSRYQYSAALASYVLSLRSFNSEFDKYVQGKTTNLDAKVKLGFNLFTGKAACATCHYVPNFSGLVPPLFQENESEVLGVLKSPNELMVDTDYGRIKNGIEDDSEEISRYSFKTVTVRNVKLTAPYFHNGAYRTLNQVIDFYNNGGAAGAGLDYEVPNQTLAPDKLNLTKKEVEALIAFMEALTDNPAGN